MRCLQCGTENAENSQYCTSCGNPLNSVVGQPRTYALVTGTLLGGRYRVGKVLGQGGFGITYKGADTRLNRLVAIKEYFLDGSTRKEKTVIPPNTLTGSDHQKAIGRFKEEAELLAKMSQHHIMQVYDFIEENDTGYIVMEYLEGKSLEKEILEKGKFGEKEAKKIILEALEGLEEVHRNGILHRDIKPGNILMTARGAVLVDFGASREFALGQSKQMSQIVTPGYAPLEQYSAKGKFGPSLDIYAMGATMYHMLTGETPPASTEVAVGEEIKLTGKVSPKMEVIIKKCMETKAQDRYKEVKELMAVLEKSTNSRISTASKEGKDQNELPKKVKAVETPVPVPAVMKNIPDMVIVKIGSFQNISLTYNYYIGKYEVTLDEYDAYCTATKKSKPNDQGWGRGKRPAINVEWWDAIKYCNWRSEREGLKLAYNRLGNLLDKSGKSTLDIQQVEGYRLPTEAEWEYAARGGQNTRGYEYAGSNVLDEVGWNDNNPKNQTHPVGEKKGNELGLYDMSGNVWEWCHDWFGSYVATKQVNPIGPNSGSCRVIRGGSCYGLAQFCRVADRSFGLPSFRGFDLGFRLVRTLFLFY